MKQIFNSTVFKSCSKTGFGRVSHLGKTFDVKGIYPSEEISFSIAKNKKSLEEVQVIKPSLNRVDVQCKHFHECGGCALMAQKIEAQEEWKADLIEQLFIEDKDCIRPIIPNPNPYHYRNKVEFTFSQNLKNEKKLGFIQFKARGFAFDIQECQLIPHWMIEAKNISQELFIKHPVDAFYLPKLNGDLKNLILRSNDLQTEVLIALVVQDYAALNQEFLSEWVERLSKAFSEKEALSIFVIEQKVQKGTPTTLKLHHLKGALSLKQMMQFELLNQQFELVFKISPLSFFQPNPHTAKILYTEAIKKLDPNPTDVVLDLYCGSGTFGMIASKFVQKVVGIEINENAILDGKELLQMNQISNVELFVGDVKNEINAFLEMGVNKMIVDPPRAGLELQVIAAINKISPETIVYVSCNPKTQIEDVKQFKNLGYAVKEITPVDQFTHTPHIENIVVLKKI